MWILTSVPVRVSTRLRVALTQWSGSFGLAGTGTRPSAAAAGPVPVPTGNPKDPQHWANATRNLVDTATGKLVKIHIYLLTHVAGRKVYL